MQHEAQFEKYVLRILQNPCHKEMMLISEQWEALPSIGIVFLIKCSVGAYIFLK